MRKSLRPVPIACAVTPFILAALCLFPGCGQHASDGTDPNGTVESTAESLVDNICTADPTIDVADAVWGNRWANSTNPKGFDLHHVNIVGPHCESASGTPGYDARCCETNHGTPSYTACKAQQQQTVEAYLATLVAGTPLLPPYRAPNVGPWQGYYYNDTTSHTGAIDFGKVSLAAGEDPSFELYAMANGKVVFADWLSGSAGNSILVRYDVAGGGYYLGEYRHVRGGRTRDKKLACACLDPTKSTSATRLAACSAADKATAICIYAADPTHDALWGTDADALPVVGTIVSRGQRIASSGNTGAVNDVIGNGAPFPANGNTHVHFSFWVPRPGGLDDGLPGTDVIAPDPLGVYSMVAGSAGGKSCYDPSAPSAYAPALAPFLPEFIAQPAAVVEASNRVLYYPNAGWGPQSLNFYNTANGVLSAGAFNPGAQNTSWKLWLEATPTFIQSEIAAYPTRKIRQLSVRLAGTSPRYTAIWEGLSAGEVAETHLDISSAELDQLWQDKIVNGPYRMTDHIEHVIAGTPHHSLTLSTTSGDFVFYWSKTAAEITSLDTSLQAQGWRPYSLAATEGLTGTDVRFSAIWRQLPGTWVIDPALTSAAFPTRLSQQKALGYQLQRVQGYDNGAHILAIWQKPDAPSCGIPSCPRLGLCAAGHFAWQPVCSASNLCPDGSAPVAGNCLVPTAADGSVNCINDKPQNCPSSAPAGTDCRVYNWELRQANGALCRDASNKEICASNASRSCDAF